MITFNLSKNGRTAKLSVPATENSIGIAQANLGIFDGIDTRVLVDNVETDIPELKILENTNQDMDALNLLGRVIDGLDCYENEKYSYAVWYEKPTELRDFVNIAISINRYSLINEENLQESGLDHEMDVRGAIPSSEYKTRDYSVVAKELLESGKCIDTPFGKKLYINEEIPIECYFDGKHMPLYYDNSRPIAVTLINGNVEDSIFLPATKDEIMRSAIRLGAYYPNDLEVRIESFDFQKDSFWKILEKANIYTLNDFANEFSAIDENDMGKLDAIIDYGTKYYKGFDNLPNITNVLKNMDCFNYIPGVSNDYDLGRYLILRSYEYSFDHSLEPYFDFAAFGEDIRGNEAGVYMDDCYIGIKDYSQIAEFMHSDEITME